MIRIRRAAARDSEALARLSAAARQEAGASFGGFEEDRVRAHGFGQSPMFEAWVAEPERGGKACAHAIAYKGYDMRGACPTFVLADLYVAPEMRRIGVARLMMATVAKRATALGCRHLSITTGLDDQIALKFYSAIGARAETTNTFKLGADQLQWLSKEVV